MARNSNKPIFVIGAFVLLLAFLNKAATAEDKPEASEDSGPTDSSSEGGGLQTTPKNPPILTPSGEEPDPNTPTSSGPEFTY